MPVKAAFWIAVGIVALVDVVFLIISPYLGLIMILILVLMIALLRLLKPDFWDSVRFERKKKAQAGSAGKEAPPVMMLERCDNSVSENIIIRQSPFEIGRASDCDFVTRDMPTVGRHHCRIIFREATHNYYIEDLQSRNGTYINSSRIPPNTPVLLKNGNLVTLDKYQYVFKPMA